MCVRIVRCATVTSYAVDSMYVLERYRTSVVRTMCVRTQYGVQRDVVCVDSMYCRRGPCVYELSRSVQRDNRMRRHHVVPERTVHAVDAYDVPLHTVQFVHTRFVPRLRFVPGLHAVVCIRRHVAHFRTVCTHTVPSGSTCCRNAYDVALHTVQFVHTLFVPRLRFVPGLHAIDAYDVTLHTSEQFVHTRSPPAVHAVVAYDVTLHTSVQFVHTRSPPVVHAVVAYDVTLHTVQFVHTRFVPKLRFVPGQHAT